MWKCESQESGGSVMRGLVGFGSGGGQVGSGPRGWRGAVAMAFLCYFPPKAEEGGEVSIAADRHAAVDDDLGSGDEAGFVGGEEQRRVSGVAAVAHESERDAGDALLAQRFDIAA